MPQRLKKYCKFLRHSSASAVWERRVRLTLLCLFFILGQSAPTALALAVQSSVSWSVVCTGAGLQLVRLNPSDDFKPDQNSPRELQSICKCTLNRDNHSCFPAPFQAEFSVPKFLHYVTYEARQNVAIAQFSKHAISCRGPPAVALGNDTFSDPPPPIWAGQYVLRRFEKP